MPAVRIVSSQRWLRRIRCARACFGAEKLPMAQKIECERLFICALPTPCPHPVTSHSSARPCDQTSARRRRRGICWTRERKAAAKQQRKGMAKERKGVVAAARDGMGEEGHSGSAAAGSRPGSGPHAADGVVPSTGAPSFIGGFPFPELSISGGGPWWDAASGGSPMSPLASWMGWEDQSVHLRICGTLPLRPICFKSFQQSIAQRVLL
uniref:Uncharacterized protein n=1 Tax=Arundo donax TaxID=35708 RepID=A0A0A9DES8_ARUDO